SSGSGSSAAIDQSHDLARQQRVGFDQATEQLIANFRAELSDFETRVKAGTADVKVVRQGRGVSGGAGAMDPLLLVLMLGCLGMAARFRLQMTTAIRAWRGTRSSANA